MQRIWNGPISKKLTLINMVVTVAALLLARFAFFAYDWYSFQKTTAQNLSIQAQIIGANTVSALVFNDPHSATSTLSALRANPHIVSAEIYDQDGHAFAGYRGDGAQPPIPAPAISHGQVESIWRKDGQLGLASQIIFQNRPVGLVYIRSDLTAWSSNLKNYTLIAIVVLAGTLLIAFLIFRAAQQSISQPIIRLAEAAGHVGREKDYTVRVTAASDHDELSTLITVFNGMLEQIQLRDNALRQAHDQLEQRVQDRTAQLVVANHELEAFSYSVSHDLRAPLRSIDGFSQAVLEDYADKLDDTGKDALQRVRAATQRMSALIDDLINLSRVSRSEMQKEELNLSMVTTTIAQQLQTSDPARNVEFAIENDVKANGDSRLLRVALENLIGNAWKYTSRKDRARIEFGSCENERQPVYFVRDNGAGFDPQYASRLFEAFQRLHSATEFPGTGIGLATVQRIVHRHGGKVWAEAAVGKGATFYFTL